MNNLKEIIRATLFVAGEGIDKEFLAEKLEVDKEVLEETIKELKAELNENSGIQIIEFKGKVQLTSNPNFADQIALVLNPIREKALTKSALETLAIIAYKQPITKLDVENIRGHSSDYALNILEENKLIEVVGRKDAVGKPLLYGTTDEFLKRFGLVNINELPDYDSLLERIKIIKQEQINSNNTTDSLYYDYKLENLDEQNSGEAPQQPEQNAPKKIERIDDIADRIRNES